MLDWWEQCIGCSYIMEHCSSADTYNESNGARRISALFPRLIYLVINIYLLGPKGASEIALTQMTTDIRFKQGGKSGGTKVTQDQQKVLFWAAGCRYGKIFKNSLF